MPKKEDKTAVNPAEDKQKALETSIANIEKRFGKGSVMKLGDRGTDSGVQAVPTGSLSLDIALGIGGIPRGRIIEIFGPESAGKTTVTLHIVAEVQKKGGIAAFIDAEHALDPVYAKKLGVNIDEMYISQPDDGEQALEIADEMVRSAAIDIIVIDSVAALTPRAEIEGVMGESHVGRQARLMSQALRKLTAFCGKNGVIVVFTNQLREKIGVTYGNPETTTGGRALKFYSSVRLDIRKGEAIKIGDNQIGNRTKIKVAKNKVSPPFKTCEFDIIFGEGISHDGDVLDLGVEVGVVQKSGSWYSYGEDRLGQGREKAKDYLRENPALLNEIEETVRKHFGLKTTAEMDGPAVAAEEPKAKGTKKKATKKDESLDDLTVEIAPEEVDAILNEMGLGGEEFDDEADE